MYNCHFCNTKKPTLTLKEADMVSSSAEVAEVLDFEFAAAGANE
jgi:hypothetical protein